MQSDALERKVFASADSIHDSNPAKTKSISKAVRTIIEHMRGDGMEVKEKMRGTSYTMGKVYLNKERVAERYETTGTLISKGSGKEYEGGFCKLMAQE